MNLRQAAQQALEEMDDHMYRADTHEFYEAKEALRAALAEPDSDYERGFVDGMNLQTKGSVDKAVNRMAQTTHWEGCEAVHPECKAKPITAAEMSAWVKDTWEKCQAEAWQEPVAWLYRDSWGTMKLSQIMPPPVGAFPVYTAPTPRKPLTDEEMRECAQAMNAEPLAEGWPELIKFARAIENKHGIGEQHE